MSYDVCSGAVLIRLFVTWSVSNGNCAAIED